MHDLLVSYYPILIFMGLSAVITAALLLVPALVAPSNPDPEKNAPYECGFEAFDDARTKFDVEKKEATDTLAQIKEALEPMRAAKASERSSGR